MQTRSTRVSLRTATNDSHRRSPRVIRSHASAYAVLLESAPVGSVIALTAAEDHTVQRCIEALIGRLITDEDFRRSFLADPHAALAAASEWGLRFTPSEIAALVATDADIWEQVADQIDPRLQKASLSQPGARAGDLRD